MCVFVCVCLLLYFIELSKYLYICFSLIEIYWLQTDNLHTIIKAIIVLSNESGRILIALESLLHCFGKKT